MEGGGAAGGREAASAAFPAEPHLRSLQSLSCNPSKSSAPPAESLSVAAPLAATGSQGMRPLAATGSDMARSFQDALHELEHDDFAEKEQWRREALRYQGQCKAFKEAHAVLLIAQFGCKAGDKESCVGDCLQRPRWKAKLDRCNCRVGGKEK